MSRVVAVVLSALIALACAACGGGSEQPSGAATTARPSAPVDTTTAAGATPTPGPTLVVKPPASRSLCDALPTAAVARVLGRQVQSAGEPADFDRNCTWLSDGDKVILKVQTEYKDGRLDRAQLLDVLRKSNAKTYDRVDRVAGAGPGVLQLYLTFESSNTTDLVATQFVTPERNLVTITYLTDRRVQAAEGLALATLAVAKVDAIV